MCIRDSECRKPAPGMILRAAREHQIDLADSLLVGDKRSDIEAGKAAGVGRLFYVTSARLAEVLADSVTVSSLGEVADNL